MIEIGCEYAKPEMTRIFGTKDKQGLDRKLNRYGISMRSAGGVKVLSIKSKV